MQTIQKIFTTAAFTSAFALLGNAAQAQQAQPQANQSTSTMGVVMQKAKGGSETVKEGANSPGKTAHNGKEHSKTVLKKKKVSSDEAAAHEKGVKGETFLSKTEHKAKEKVVAGEKAVEKGAAKIKNMFKGKTALKGKAAHENAAKIQK